MTKKLNKTQLQELVNSLAWNDGYGCYTRAGFEKLIWPTIVDKAKWIIFFDIDDMHALNEKHGHSGVDAIIRKCLAMRASDYVAGQHYSGDEFIICVTDDNTRGVSDPYALCERLMKTFAKDGVPATFAIVPVISKILIFNVEPALKIVENAKCKNQRGTITMIGG